MTNKLEFQKNCLISIGVIVLYFFWPTILSAFFETFGGKEGIVLTIYNVIGYIILVGLLIAIYHKSLKEEWKRFWENKKKCFLYIIKYTGILFISVLLFNMVIQGIFHVKIIDNEVHLYEQFEKTKVLMILMLTLYYPIVEVIIFQKTIKQVIKKPWLFIVVSGLFFGYFNVAFTEFTISNVVGSLQYVLFNGVLAYTYCKKDTIVVPVGIKMFYNLLVTLFSIL